MDAMCSSCAYLSYDEDYEEYICDCQMDEDDYWRISEKQYNSGPYYRNGDEYRVVRKQL